MRHGETDGSGKIGQRVIRMLEEDTESKAPLYNSCMCCTARLLSDSDTTTDASRTVSAESEEAQRDNYRKSHSDFSRGCVHQPFPRQLIYSALKPFMRVWWLGVRLKRSSKTSAESACLCRCPDPFVEPLIFSTIKYRRLKANTTICNGFLLFQSIAIGPGPSRCCSDNLSMMSCTYHVYSRSCSIR